MEQLHSLHLLTHHEDDKLPKAKAEPCIGNGAQVVGGPLTQECLNGLLQPQLNKESQRRAAAKPRGAAVLPCQLASEFAFT